MSSYMNQGLRKTKLIEKKSTKAHVKSFYKIIGEMDTVAKQLNPDLEYDEDNINEYVNPIYGRDLDAIEKILVIGKLHHAKQPAENETEDNSK